MPVTADIADQTASLPQETLALMHDVVASIGSIIFGEGAYDVTVMLVTDAEIGALHDRWFNDPAPTDVITFPSHGDDDEPDPHDPHLGDIVLSVDTARVAAAEVGWPIARDVAFVLVHGMLHLAGWDDATDAERNAMLAEGERLLQQFEQTSGTTWS